MGGKVNDIYSFGKRQSRKCCKCRDQLSCKFGSQFYHQTLIVGQSTVQIYIKRAMDTQKLYTKFSLMNACSSLFVWFSSVLVCPKQRKTKMAKMNLGEVVLRFVYLRQEVTPKNRLFMMSGDTFNEMGDLLRAFEESLKEVRTDR